MDAGGFEDDVRAIEALIARQFESLNWKPGAPADWQRFAADFLPGALLYPAVRPVTPQSVEAFVDRMKGLAGTTLESFHEALAGIRVHVFGNIAVVVAACEMRGNKAEVKRSVEMLLLVKSDGAWQVAAQAWDPETPDKPIPAEFLARA